MVCPICIGERIPSDTSVVETRGKRVVVQGRVHAIIQPHYTYSPYKDFATVSLYPRKGKVKYLKFRTERELERWPFAREETFVVGGCLHIVDDKELIFDVTSAEVVTQ